MRGKIPSRRGKKFALRKRGRRRRRRRRRRRLLINMRGRRKGRREKGCLFLGKEAPPPLSMAMAVEEEEELLYGLCHYGHLRIPILKRGGRREGSIYPSLESARKKREKGFLHGLESRKEREAM